MLRVQAEALKELIAGEKDGMLPTHPSIEVCASQTPSRFACVP